MSFLYTLLLLFLLTGGGTLYYILRRKSKRKKVLNSILYAGSVEEIKKAMKEIKNIEDILAVEKLLISADTGTEGARKIIEGALKKKELPLREAIKETMKEILRVCEAKSLPEKDGRIKYILVIGINGAGKTLFCVKLARYAKKQGFNPCLVAGDRFRAAGASQLEVMGKKYGLPVFSGKEGIPADAILHDSFSFAKKHGYDLVIADTAGRNHVNESLIRELKKLCSVVEKVKGAPPEEVLLIIDANLGQSSIRQVEAFSAIGRLTGVVLAKADSSAKGGVIFGICQRGIPVKFISAGEDPDSIYPFDPARFIEAIMEE